MGGQYISLIWRDDASRAEAERIAEHASRAFSVCMATSSPRARVLASESLPVISLAEGRGAIIGEIFPRVGALRKVDRLDAATSRQLIETGGGHLMKEYWGEYVAIFFGDGEHHILREPSGALSCYALRHKGIDIILSDIEIGAALGLIGGEIDWPVLGHWLAQPGLRAETTCIKGVREVFAGTCLSRSDSSFRRRTVWNPWTFAAADKQFADRDEAVESLRHAALLATKAWAAQTKSALLEMSGGLDSSVVAACLRKADIPVTCVSLWTPDPGADERQYAQAVADHIAAPLHLVRLSAADVELTNVSPVRKPRPNDHPLKRISDLAFEREGLSRNVDSFFSGSGGDYVLGYLASSAPAADALIARGPGRTFFNAVADVAALHGCSVWRVGALASRKALRRSAGVGGCSAPFLSNDVRALIAQDHPWCVAPRNQWPGKRKQIDSLIRGQGVREERDRRLIAPLRMPLLSQPVVETCLRTPSWMTVTGGRNRAVARDAFADQLPQRILKRRTKGNFARFNAAIFNQNRAVLQDLLLDGRLNAHGFLDRRAIEDFLGMDRPLTDNSFTTILQLASVELWTRTWR